MYTGDLIINGIRSSEPLELGKLNCFEVLLKCNYGTCKRHLHKLFINLILDDELVTYELVERGKDSSLVRVYVRNSKVIEKLKNKLASIIAKDFTYVGVRRPTYQALETFFDLIVSAAFRKANFEVIRGKGKVLDPIDKSKSITKRTILEVRNTKGVEKYHGILFIDYSVISRSSLADRILEELGIDYFEEISGSVELRRKALEIAQAYVGKHVLTIIKRRGSATYVYGSIVGVEPVFSKDKRIGESTLYSIWYERYREGIIESEPSEWEFPLFKVRVDDLAQPLTYPPSALRLFEQVERHDPSTRWDNIRRLMKNIENNIKTIYERLTGKPIKFRYIRTSIGTGKVGIRPNFYTGSYDERQYKDHAIKLKYKCSGRERQAVVSPIYALNKMGCTPYAGKQEISLVLVYPSTIKSNDVKDFVDNLASLFNELNMGSISNHELYAYRYEPLNVTESLASLEKVLESLMSSESYFRERHFPLVIIPSHEQFYKSTKDIASKYGFHTQVISVETFSTVRELLSQLKHNIAKPKKNRIQNSLRSILANICGGIYAEFLIQKGVAGRSLAGPLTWILASPADGKGQSMYVGLDVSTKRGVSGAAFIVLDPYGKLVDARIIQLKSEQLSYHDYYDVFRYMVSKARELGLSRIVVLRDGTPKSPNELRDCINAFTKVRKELRYEVSLDYVSVIKRTAVRAFAILKGEKTRGEKANPLQGTYVYMYKTRHFSYDVHEVLVVASRPEAGDEEDTGGTARPIILRLYELGKNYGVSEAMSIAEEYLALTRLNFWNLRTGASKLALPIKMADILSYMLSMGIQIRT